MADVRSALGPFPLEEAAALGLIAVEGEDVRALLRISGYEDLLFAYDFYTPQTMKRPDVVLGVSPASVSLVSLTVRRPVERALDLGTGCGIQALLASRHARHVVATDINQRALDIAALNARLNGIENVEFRKGSLFEPVQHDRFDLIVSNPPFVISPDNAFEYRDSGMRGDTICRLVVREAAGHLSEGGFATFLCNWAQTEKDETAAEVVGAWIEGAPVDTWVLHDPPLDATTYASRWIGSPDAEAYAADLDRWTAYYQELGINAITFGGVILRRRTAGDNWLRIDELPDTRRRTCGSHIERVFDAQDYLQATPRDQIMQTALVLTPDVRVEQATRPGEDGMELERASLEFTQGIPLVAALNLHSLQMINRCDGVRTLQEISDEIASAVGAPAEDVSKGVIGVAVLMIGLGFLAPAAEGGRGRDKRKEAKR